MFPSHDQGVKSKLIDNFTDWTTDERKEFGLFKTTMIKRIKDNSTVEWNEETLPDKELVRESLQNNDGKAPKEAHLQRKFSFVFMGFLDFYYCSKGLYKINFIYQFLIFF